MDLAVLPFLPRIFGGIGLACKPFSTQNFKGSGQINRSGNYGFLVTGIDGDLNQGAEKDKFRIKIWDKDAGDLVVYDNKRGSSETVEDATDLSGGSIKIHKNENDNLARGVEQLGFLRPPSGVHLKVFPNPFSKRITVNYEINHGQEVHLEVFDLQGRIIKTIFSGYSLEGKHEFV